MRSPTNSSRNSRRPLPMPCSPESWPPSFFDSAYSSVRLACVALFHSSSLISGPRSISVWMLPSPQWPQGSTRMPCDSAMRLAALTYSAMQARGTTTSHSSCATESAFMPSRIPPPRTADGRHAPGCSRCSSRRPWASAASAAASHRAVKLLSARCVVHDDQHGLALPDRQQLAEIALDDVDQLALEEFDRRRDKRQRQHLRHHVRALLQTAKRHDERARTGRRRQQLERNLRQDAQRALRADDQILDIVASGVFLTTLDEKFMMEPSGRTVRCSARNRA